MEKESWHVAKLLARLEKTPDPFAASLLTQPCLCHDTFQGLRMYIIARVASDCHAPQLTTVLKLAVATFGRYQIPAIFFQKLEYLTYLHTDAHHTLR